VEPGCLFCRLAEGELPAFVVASDEQTVAVLDAWPAAPGHTLVLPRRHVAHLWAADEETAVVLMRSVHRVAALLRDRLRPDGLTLRQNTGAASGQQVAHLHVHLVPRWHGDGHVGWPTRPEPPPDPAEVLARLRPR
jgi:histidine triad (HIT) family protein